MSTSEFGKDDPAGIFDFNDWMPIDKEAIDAMRTQVDNAVRLDDAKITVSRDAAWHMRDLEVRVNVSREFPISDGSDVALQLGVMLFKRPEDETEYAPPEEYIKSTYSNRDGIKLDISGDTGFDARCLAEMCLYTGQIARAGIVGQANPDSLKSPAIRERLSVMHETLHHILMSDTEEAYDIVNGFNTASAIRNEAIKNLPTTIMDLLRRTRLGATLIYRRVHLGVAVEGDATLSVFTSMAHLNNGQDETCNYRRIYTPSSLTSLNNEGAPSRVVQYLTIIDDQPQPLIVTEETPQEALEEVAASSETTALSSLEPVSAPVTECTTRDALFGDYKRLKPELAVLSEKYGI